MGSALAIQVRLWRTERTKDEILRFMRISGSEELMNQRQDMIAYWDFNEPDDDRQATCAALQQPAALILCLGTVGKKVPPAAHLRLSLVDCLP